MMIQKDRVHLWTGKAAKNTMLFVLCFKAEFYILVIDNHWLSKLLVINVAWKLRSLFFSSSPFCSVPFRSISDNDIETQRTSLDWQGSQNTMLFVLCQKSTYNGFIYTLKIILTKPDWVNCNFSSHSLFPRSTIIPTERSGTLLTMMGTPFIISPLRSAP